MSDATATIRHTRRPRLGRIPRHELKFGWTDENGHRWRVSDVVAEDAASKHLRKHSINVRQMPNEQATETLRSLQAITLHQPWASLMVTRDPTRTDRKPAKEWETRSWCPKILPTRLAIHAAPSITPAERRAILVTGRFIEPYASILERCGFSPCDPWAPDYEARQTADNQSRLLQRLGDASWLRPLPLGCVVGVARLARVLRAEVAAETIGRERGASGKTEIALGDFQVGRYAWQMTDARALDIPLICTGARDVWTLNPKAAASIDAMLAPR